MSDFRDIVLNCANADDDCQLIKIIRYDLNSSDLKWLKNKAEEGNSNAQNFYGETVYILENDYEEAVKWYKKSAKQNNKFGLFNLGYMFEHGKGVPGQDWRTAIRLFRISSELGSLAAKIRYDILKKNKMFNVTEHLKIVDENITLKIEKRLRQSIDIPEVLIELIASYVDPMCLSLINL